MLRRNYMFFKAVFVVVVTISILFAQGTRKCWVKSLTGDVRVQRKGSVKWINARPSQPLKAGDAIRTFVESDATLQTTEGSVIRIAENTTFEISKLTGSPGGATSTKVKVLSGNIIANVKKLVSTKSEFSFETPTATAAIRGTKLGIDVVEGKTDVKVYEGRVWVAPKGAKHGKEITKNQVASVKKGSNSIEIKKFKGTFDDATGDKNDNSTETSDSTETSSDSSATDTSAVTVDSLSGSDSVEIDTLSSAKDSVKFIELKIISPVVGQVVFKGSNIAVAGIVKPAGSNVRVRGKTVPVSSDGEFKIVLPAPKEVGEYDMEIEAQFERLSRTEKRHFFVKEQGSNFMLNIFSPKDGSVITEPLVVLRGMTTPSAELSVMGEHTLVTKDGNFEKKIPIPDEDGRIEIEVEAVLNGKNIAKNISVTYKRPKEDISFTLNKPAKDEIVCSKNFSVAATVRPFDATVELNGIKLLNSNGMVSGRYLINEDPGNISLDFEVSSEDNDKTFKSSINYQPASKKCNTEAPVINPGALPNSSIASALYFTVTDNTLFDEIKFYTSVDGSKDFESGTSGTKFRLNLEEGLHLYEVYAEDLAGNRSNVLHGKVAYLSKDMYISVDKPSKPLTTIHIPPAAPGHNFSPKYTVEFSIENLPDDNTELLKEVRVNCNGTIQSKSEFKSSPDFSFDVKLSKGDNTITIDARNINDKVVSTKKIIRVR